MDTFSNGEPPPFTWRCVWRSTTAGMWSSNCAYFGWKLQVGWLTVSWRFCWFWCQRIKESMLPVCQRDGLWLKLKMSEVCNMSFIIIKLLMKCSNEMLPLIELWYSQPGVFQYKIFPLPISLTWHCRSWTWIYLVEDLLAPGLIFEQFSIRILASKQTILISNLVSGNGHSAKRSRCAFVWCDYYFFFPASVWSFRLDKRDRT